MKKRITYLILTICWMSAIFYFSSETAENSSNDSSMICNFLIGIFTDNPSDTLLYIMEVVIRKLAHMTEFFILGVLVYKTIGSFEIAKKLGLICVCICFFYALSDEIHQLFVPGRACRWYDVLIDTCGSLIAVGAFKLVNKKNN